LSHSIHPEIERVLISEQELQTKIAELAARISKDYKGRTPVFVGVLRGCLFFIADLMKQLTIDASIDFICPSTYQGGTKSTGVVRLLLDLRDSIEGKDVIIVEDIVDSGLTMTYLLANLKTRKPRSIEVCTLLEKPSRRKAKVDVKYSCFDIPDEFVVGYGLDYEEIYRNLPYIGVLKPSRIKK